METLNTYAQPFFDWLLRNTFQASVVICMILLIQGALRGRLTARWHYVLWLILVARMILPWAPQSRFSIFNLTTWQTKSNSPIAMLQLDTELSETTGESATTQRRKAGQEQSLKADGIASAVTSEVPSRPLAAEPSTQSAFRLHGVLPFIWLAGALLLGGYIIICNLKLWRAARIECPSTDKEMLELLEECRSEIGLRTIVALVPSKKVNTPILLGFVRPRLLVPKSITKELTREELRYVLLHELAHVKRHDIALGWLTTLLQVLHWFNPLVWLAFHRMRSNRELACDALVLSRTQDEATREYGRAIVSLLEHFSLPQSLPGLAGILESKSQLKRRIAMIAQFKKNSYHWSPLGVILVIILACVSLPNPIYTKASGISSATPSAIVVRQVWTDAADPQFLGAPSPDGKYLSYVDWETGDLAVHELATGKNRRLTNKRRSQGSVGNSVFSPDSRQVAYFWWSQEKGSELRIVGLDGSAPRVVNQDEEASIYSRGIYPTGWTPDGKHILALGRKRDRSLEILLVPVEDGPVRILKTLGKKLPDGRRVPGLCLSPDGRYVAYTFLPNEESMNRDISVIATDGSHEIPLEKHPADDFVLGWAPDSKRVVFASDRTGSMGIWAVDVAEGKMQSAPQLLKPEVGQFYPLGVTQNGSFYYGVYAGSCNVYSATYSPQRGDITAKPVIAVHRYEGSNWAPDWSPDGKYLACVSASPGVSPVFLIRSVKSGEVRKLSPDLRDFNLHSLRWSADGRFLLGSGKTKDVFWGVLKIDVETGEVTVIVEGPGIFGPHWAADGKAVFYVCNLKTNGGIIRHDLATGEKKELYNAPGFISALVLSPDGQQLAFYDIQGSALKVFSTTGGEPRELVKVEGKITIAWTPDGRQLVYGSRGLGEGPGNLWRISAGGGEPQKLDLEMPYLGHVRFRPDGRQIAFMGKVGKDKCEVWVMENFLPQTEKAPVVTTRLVWPIGADLGGGKPSPDGRYLMFVDANSGDVGLRELSTGKSRLLTHEGSRWASDGERAFWPQISPDGERVVYTWRSSSKGHGWQLRIVGIDGSKPRIVYPRKNGHSDDEKIFPLTVGWLPDSKHILVYQTKHSSNKSIQNQILLIPLADGPIRVLKTLSEEPAKNRPERRYAMSLSPDGRYLAYSREQPGNPSNRDIFLMPLDGTEETALVTHPKDDYVLGWAPDGQRLLFAERRNKAWDAWVIQVVDGKPQGAPELVRPNIGLVRPIGVTQDSSFYYVLHFPSGMAVHTAQLDLETGKVVTPPAPAEERSLGVSGEPTWSPDGKYLAYWSRDGVSYRISILSIETGQVRQLDRKLNFYGALRWSPDGQSILTTAQPKRGGPFGVFQIDTQTGDAKTLVEPGQGAGRAAWSPDGKGIFFVKDSGIMFRNLQTSSNKEILPPDRSGFDSVPVLMIDVSPDGQQVAVYGQETKSKAMVLKVIPASGRQARELLRLEKESPNRQPLVWTRDGQSLLLIRDGSEETRGLWRIPIDGGKCQRLELPWTGWLMDLSVHPDGQRIAFVMDQRRKEEVWVMENFLPQNLGK